MNNLFKITMFACLLTIGFTACKKDKSTPEEPEYQAKVMVKDGETKNLAEVSTTVNTQGTINRKGQLYSLRNFRQFIIDDNGSATTTVATAYYLDPKENDGASEDDAPIRFNAASTNVDITANADKGYELSYIDKSFDAVTANDQFIAAIDNKLGLQSTYTPNVIGWANYTGSPNHRINPVADRTIILSKDGKVFFKLRVNSIYENETPNKEVAPDNYFYYSIDYQEFK